MTNYKFVLQQLNLVIQNVGVKAIAFDPIYHFFQKSMRVRWIVRHTRKRQRRALPRIEIIHFGGRDVKMIAHAREDRLDNMPLAFQRVIAENFELDCANADNHKSKDER